MTKNVYVSKRQRSRVTSKRQLARRNPSPVDAFRTRPVWDKAISLAENSSNDVDELVKWAEQMLAAGKLEGFVDRSRAILDST